MRRLSFSAHKSKNAAMILHRILIRYSFAAVFNADNTAGNEAVFGKHILHRDIVAMRIRAHVFAVEFAKIERGFADAANFSVACHTVHHVIRLVRCPFAVYNGIGGVVPLYKGKNAVDILVFRTNVEVAVFYIG